MNAAAHKRTITPPDQRPLTVTFAAMTVTPVLVRATTTNDAAPAEHETAQNN